jgi:hypothetical protein
LPGRLPTDQQTLNITGVPSKTPFFRSLLEFISDGRSLWVKTQR